MNHFTFEILKQVQDDVLVFSRHFCHLQLDWRSIGIKKLIKSLDLSIKLKMDPQFREDDSIYSLVSTSLSFK